jgi:hypothetical protein
LAIGSAYQIREKNDFRGIFWKKIPAKIFEKMSGRIGTGRLGANRSHEGVPDPLLDSNAKPAQFPDRKPKSSKSSGKGNANDANIPKSGSAAPGGDATTAAAPTATASVKPPKEFKPLPAKHIPLVGNHHRLGLNISNAPIFKKTEAERLLKLKGKKAEKGNSNIDGGSGIGGNISGGNISGGNYNSTSGGNFSSGTRETVVSNTNVSAITHAEKKERRTFDNVGSRESTGEVKNNITTGKSGASNDAKPGWDSDYGRDLFFDPRDTRLDKTGENEWGVREK